MRGALRPDVNVDADDFFVTDDEVLARLGGVTPLDRVDIAQVKGANWETFGTAMRRRQALSASRATASR